MLRDDVAVRQVMVKVPTVSIDKTDGCMVYLSKDSLATQLVTAKSSEMNILVPDNTGEFVSCCHLYAAFHFSLSSLQLYCYLNAWYHSKDGEILRLGM